MSIKARDAVADLLAISGKKRSLVDAIANRVNVAKNRDDLMFASWSSAERLNWEICGGADDRQTRRDLEQLELDGIIGIHRKRLPNPNGGSRLNAYELLFVQPDGLAHLCLTRPDLIKRPFETKNTPQADRVPKDFRPVPVRKERDAFKPSEEKWDPPELKWLPAEEAVETLRAMLGLPSVRDLPNEEGESPSSFGRKRREAEEGESPSSRLARGGGDHLNEGGEAPNEGGEAPDEAGESPSEPLGNPPLRNPEVETLALASGSGASLRFGAGDDEDVWQEPGYLAALLADAPDERSGGDDCQTKSGDDESAPRSAAATAVPASETLATVHPLVVRSQTASPDAEPACAAAAAAADGTTAEFRYLTIDGRPTNDPYAAW